MNVKAGELVIQIRSSMGNEGKIGKVISFLGDSPVYEGFRWHSGRGPCWLVEFASPVVNNHGMEWRFAPTPDAWLRPISGIPDEETTNNEIKELA